MQKLFFELLQVALGQKDCLDRGPSPEEWRQLYEMCRQHGLAALGYQGVVRLFDFGLRAPQDLSIDWMADAEAVDGLSAQPVIQQPLISHPLRRMLYVRWTMRNGGALYAVKGQRQEPVVSAAFVMLMLQSFEDFHTGVLSMRQVVDCFELMRRAEGRFSPFADGSTLSQMLQTLGIWHFSRSMMWGVGETLAADRRLMPCQPDSGRGPLVLEQLMDSSPAFVERMKRRLKRLFLF